MNNHTILAVLLIAMLLLFFGCSGEDPNASNTSSTSNTNESVSTNEEEVSEIPNTQDANEFKSTYQGLQAKLFDG